MEDASELESRERPEFLYHGSDVGGIEELEPQKIYVPKGNRRAPPSVYASDKPAFAISHSFEWSSDEGFDVYEKRGKMILEVPERFRNRLDQEAYLYKVSSENFTIAEDEETGLTWRAVRGVKPINVEKFNSVREAFERFGGKIVFVNR